MSAADKDGIGRVFLLYLAPICAIPGLCGTRLLYETSIWFHTDELYMIIFLVINTLALALYSFRGGASYLIFAAFVSAFLVAAAQKDYGGIAIYDAEPAREAKFYASTYIAFVLMEISVYCLAILTFVALATRILHKPSQ